MEENASIQTVPTKGHTRTNTISSFKARPRLNSRASTTSIQSATTQPMLDEQHLERPQIEYRQQWSLPEYDANMQRRYSNMDHQPTPDNMNVHMMPHMQHARPYGADSALGASGHHNLVYSHDTLRHDVSRQSMTGDGYGTSFAEDDTPMLETRSDEQDDVDSVVGGNGGPKKSSKSSAANELEMRALFAANKDRTLPEVASELHGNERGPQSERTRQVFAMLWINQTCDKGKGSVPRGRVYANYVSRCATERVTVLNPASFGKLVRVLFPGLRTRRLGVRGESKYHYVNFSLKDDTSSEAAETGRHSVPPAFDVPRFPQEQVMQNGHLPSDRAVFPPIAQQAAPERQLQRPRISGDPSPQARSLYNTPLVQNSQQLEMNTGKMIQKLRFALPSDSSNHEYESIVLPNIDQYLPAGTDHDAATALAALYRSHCTSLVDAIRFVKQKTFFHLYTSFHGTLTMPVQKLFANASIAHWIEECDFVMYQKMMRVVDHLTLEVVPQAILDTLHQISERLVPHIQQSFQGHPAHVIQAKIAPATLFAGLLDRLCRVNLTAHAAANMLSHAPNRDQMYDDWMQMVRVRKVAENVPTRAMDDVSKLLVYEIKNLLDPLQVQWEIESMTIYGDVAARNSNLQQDSIHADASTENVLDRWVNFLVQIPERFPYASPDQIVIYVERVGNAVMRDLTIKSGQSFGAWWVTKCWIDEMVSFMVEKGGFMDYTSTRSHDNRSGVVQQVDSSFPQQIHQHPGPGHRAYNHMSMSNGHQSGPHIVTGPMAPSSQAAMNSAAGYDDSGVGLQTPEDDFALSKFGFQNVQVANGTIL